MKSVGNLFSWTNRNEVNKGIESKIDHALVNNEFLMKNANQLVHYIPNILSDHSPLVVKLGQEAKGGGSLFKYFNCLILHLEFEEVVKKYWMNPLRRICLIHIWHKLRNVKKGIKTLHRQEFEGVHHKIDDYRRRLEDCQINSV